ncbi:acetyltransferase (GNAT) family protein [Kineothrix alysoides]|uniref:Acetyltransferase (GNAT) family protein n=1 Tax=Kineothrix alysoides TaxID=1469948 RepID=A0A4R1R189_9FIRM|nr:GNAT family N-acetyltransferase [Kineothrix alysoides]TCL59081.1 acetyltransferase (GNAT) family protein [Kineothrix alysoides]
MDNITYKLTKEDVNWQEVSDVLRRSGLSNHSQEEQEIIFKNSYAVVFVYDEDKIVGVGRALSDGICQAAVYNIALDEEYQGYGIGRRLITSLLEQLKGQNIILYTHPRTVALYEKMGFRRNKTAMCIFDVGKEKQEWMEQEGFLLPEKYRFTEEISKF